MLPRTMAGASPSAIAVLPTRRARLDQRRVVLGAPAEDLDDPLDLHGAADDGVEGVLQRQLGEVTAELVEQGGLARLLLRLLGLLL